MELGYEGRLPLIDVDPALYAAGTKAPLRSSEELASPIGGFVS